jgi:hypothetical protein
LDFDKAANMQQAMIARPPRNCMARYLSQ